MEAARTNLSANRLELSVTVSAEEMSRFARQAATHLSEHTAIEGFRPGKAPYDVVKTRLGEMAILEEASRIAIGKTIDEAVKKNITEEWIGQPQITIVKLAPDNDFSYKALITLLPSVELGKYKEMGMSAEKVSVSDEEVEKVINHLAEGRVKETAVNRPAEKDDKLIIDIEMFLDNVPLEGGQNRDTAVVLGKEYLVPSFDEHLIGIKRDEERTFSVHYPSDHYQKNIAGKDVTFKVKAKDLFARELPNIDDDFAKVFGLPTVIELRTSIKSNLEMEKQQEAKHKLEHAMLQAIVKNSTIGDVPEGLLVNELEMMLKELEHSVISAGGKFNEYMTSLGKTLDSLKQELRPTAIERVKTSLVLRAIVKTENISVTEKEIDEELETLRKRYGHDPKALETLGSVAYRRHTESLLLNRKVVSNLLTWNSDGI